MSWASDKIGDEIIGMAITPSPRLSSWSAMPAAAPAKNEPRYIVTRPVPGGYAWWNIVDRQSSIMPNFAAVTISKEVPRAGAIATLICADLNNEPATLQAPAVPPSCNCCETCGSLVPMDYVNRHDMWHEKLRRAVDEAEMLG